MRKLILKPHVQEKFVEIHPGIHLCKQWLDLDDEYNLTMDLKKLTEPEWDIHYNWKKGDAGEYWVDKLSKDIVPSDFRREIINTVAPYYWSYQHYNFVRLREGQSSEIHQTNNPNPGWFNPNLEWNLAVYLGEWEGGEICFPDQDFCYKPESSDMLIFDADYRHKTNTVTSGTRYCYIDFVARGPGYFMA
jgi:hypothetical protein